MTKGNYPRHSLPIRAGLDCGCSMRMSKRKYDYGEVWCYVHRRAAKVTTSVAVVPKSERAPKGMPPLF